MPFTARLIDQRFSYGAVKFLGSADAASTERSSNLSEDVQMARLVVALRYLNIATQGLPNISLCLIRFALFPPRTCTVCMELWFNWVSRHRWMSYFRSIEAIS